MAHVRDAEVKQSSSTASRQRELAQLRGALGKPLQISDIQQEPFRSILRKAGKTLNIRGKQFYNLIDVSLSDEEPEPQPTKRLSGPPTSVALKRAFGIEEPRKSGQALMDFFGDRWVEFSAPCESDQDVKLSSARRARKEIQPEVSTSITEIRRPWFEHIAGENYDPPDPSRPASPFHGHDNENSAL